MSCTGCYRGRNERPNLKNRSFSWRAITAWSMLDFSNSIIIMVLYGSYATFVTSYIYDVIKEGSANLMYANIAVTVLTFFISPPIGVLIDNYYIRLPIVIISVIGYSVSMMALYGVKPGDKVRPIVFYAIGGFFFRLNEMVTGAFLPALCNERDMGFVSSYGYFIGFLSGVIVSLLVKLFITAPASYDALSKVNYTINGYSTAMMVCGIVCLLSALPPMLMLDNGVPEGEKRPKWHAKAIGESFKQTGRAIRDGFKVNRSITAIMLVYILLYIPIQTSGSYIGTWIIYWTGPHTKYGITIGDVQNALIYYNAGVAVFSLVWAMLTWVTSSYWIVMIIIIVFIVDHSVGFWYRSLELTESFNPGMFLLWAVFVLGSICIGPVQALLRGVVGLLTPEERKGEVFGCLESIILFGGIIGSTIPQLLIDTTYWSYSLWSMVFTVVGFVCWMFVPVRKEEEKARARIKAREEAEIAAQNNNDNDGEAALGVGIEIGDDSSSSESSNSSSSSSASSNSNEGEEEEGGDSDE